MISKLSIFGLLALTACLQISCAVQTEKTAYLLTPQQTQSANHIVYLSSPPSKEKVAVRVIQEAAETTPKNPSQNIKSTEEGRENTKTPSPSAVTAPIKRARLSPQTTSTLEVYSSIPVPTGYSPARASGNVVIPATPTGFEQRKVGTMQQVSPDGRTTLSSTQLEGFINYGSPIRVPVAGPNGKIHIQETPNTIVQPVFQTIRVTR
jgi:hypothetical protein